MMARVLLIDDSAFQNAWMSALLARGGHTAVAACSGEEATSLCRAWRGAKAAPFNVCFIELILLRENGFELSALEALRSLPVVLMLARRQEADLAWAQALGIRHFLYRPCRQEVLEQLLQDILPEAMP